MAKPTGGVPWDSQTRNPSDMNTRPTVLFPVSAIVLLVASSAAAQLPVERKHTETLLAPFPPEVRESALVSPDCRHIVYVEESDAGQAAVLDGRKQATYDRVVALEFSPDGNRLAYAARQGPAWHVVVDGREQGPYERVGPPRFSPDSACRLSPCWAEDHRLTRAHWIRRATRHYKDRFDVPECKRQGRSIQ